MVWGEGEPIFYKGVAHGGWNKFQWMAYHNKEYKGSRDEESVGVALVLGREWRRGGESDGYM